MFEEIVTRPEDLAACCADLARFSAVGFDTEFVGEETYHPNLCLIQVATPEKLILIDPFTVGPLDAFWELIADPARTIVVHAGREEVRLCRLLSGRTPANVFDLQLAAGLIGLPYPLGHGPLVYHVLRVQLAKGETLTEWRERPLTKEQIRYAFDDVRHLLAAWEKLNRRLTDLGRIEWAKEEFERLKSVAVATPAETERFRKLRGAGSLDSRRLAVLRELCAWREEKAARQNRPARTVVRDDLLVDVARRNPTRQRDLEVVRGLAKRELGEIMEAVARARALPPDQWPEAVEREQDPPQLALVTNVLVAALADWCARHHLAPNLTASAQDVRQLVRAKQQGEALPENSGLTRGWRAAHVLPDLLAMLEGRRTLRIRDVSSPNPFTFSDD